MRSLALTLFVMGVIPIALLYPVAGLSLWAWFSYMNPHRLAYGFAYSFSWVMLSALVTFFSIALHRDQCQKIPWRPITVLLAMFLIWTGLSSLTAIKPDLAQDRWVDFVKVQALTFTTLIVVIDRRRLHVLLWVIVLSFGFWGFKGGFFTVVHGGQFHVMGPYGSFFRDNNGFALVMCMTLPLMRYLQLQTPYQSIRWALWLLMGFTVFSVVGTYSRGGLLALVATLLMLILKSRRRVSVLIVIAITVPLLWGFMPQQWIARMNTLSSIEQVNTFETRVESWQFAFNIAQSNPLLGGGFRVWASDPAWNQFGPPDAVHRAIHSSFFQVIGEHGFVGIGLFIALLVVGWRSLARIRKNARSSPETQWMADLASMLQVCLVAYVIAGSALPMAYFDYLYQILGIIVVLQTLLHKATSKAEQRDKTVPRSKHQQTSHHHAPDHFL